MKSIRTAVIFVAFLSVLGLLPLVSSQAHAAVYTIRKGDTPAKIAKRLGVSTESIIKSAGVGPRDLRPGVRIVVPDRSTAAATSRKTSLRKSGTSGSFAESGHRQLTPSKSKHTASGHDAAAAFHKVKKGETLASIAKKYGTSVSALKEMNHLTSSRLRTKQQLIVRAALPESHSPKGRGAFVRNAKSGAHTESLTALDDQESEDPAYGADSDAVGQREPSTVHDDLSSSEEKESDASADKPLTLDRRTELIAFAKRLLDIPYKFGGSSILGIDCSGYVKRVYGMLGIDLPRTAREQYKEGQGVTKDDLAVGDLVFFRTYASFPSHVGIYLGNNLFIHASSKGKKVTIDSLETPYYLKHFIGGKRLLIEGIEEETSGS